MFDFLIENISTDNNPGEGSRKIRKLSRLFLSLISVSTRVAVERTPLIFNTGDFKSEEPGSNQVGRSYFPFLFCIFFL